MLYNGMIEKNEVDTLLGKIKDEAQRMNTLIQDIILVSKLDEGGAVDTFEEVNLCAIASEASEALTLNARENNIDIGVSCAAEGDLRIVSGEGLTNGATGGDGVIGGVSIKGGPDDIGALTESGVVMRADRSMMYELFFNLMDNAIKYNKPGGKVNVDIQGGDGQIIITVTDTGIGIPKKSRSRVFERFYRVDKSRSKKKGGTGLGLAIVKHIVMIHNGRVDLESHEGNGTTVTVLFP
jgi:two-component system phosphate regulon sensor histidine kinase PhoR